MDYGTQYTQDKNYCTVTYEVDYYLLEFVVFYVPNDYDGDGEYGATNDFKFNLQIPIELELNFTQKSFDEWAAKVGKENKKKRRAEALEELKRVGRYLYGDDFENWLPVKGSKCQF